MIAQQLGRWVLVGFGSARKSIRARDGVPTSYGKCASNQRLNDVLSLAHWPSSLERAVWI